MSSLANLKKPISSELKAFEVRFKAAMKSSVPLLDRITYYIVQSKGKQIRPMFVFLCARLISAVKEETYIAASLIELLHTATLVHDDVVDDSHKRRKFFSINALWKNKIAVLVGDYLLSKGLLLALENKQYETLQIFTDAVREMSEGELLQIEKSRKLNITEEIYFEIIRQKTASLLAAACASGVSSVGGSEEQVRDMKEFGLLVGMAYQIKDDLFDYGYLNIGKPTGIDIKERKLTLPLIYALGQADPGLRKKIRSSIRKAHKRSVQKDVIAFVKSHGGMEYAESKMNAIKDKALLILEKYEDSEPKSTLIELVHYVIERKS